MLLYFVFDDLYLVDLVVVDLSLCKPRFIMLFVFSSGLGFDCLSTSQVIGREGCLRYEWDIKP